MSVRKIQQLANLLGLKENTIIDETITRLTAPGENYGSLMLKVDIKVQQADGTTQDINAVAKMLPLQEFMQTFFNSKITLRNELEFYRTVVPTLQQFQQEHGIENVIKCFPKYYGGRFNLNDDNNEVDDDAIILLENVAIQNYKNLDRLVGFDLEASKFILCDIAQLHATGIALKIKNLKLFETKVKNYLAPFVFLRETEGSFQKAIISILSKIPKCAEFVDRVESAIMNTKQIVPSREPFATISHNDFWVNNTMVLVENGCVIDNKIVDFQACEYGSPARDLIFFLLSSVQNEVVLKYYDDLVRFYYDRFIGVLRQFGIDTKMFSFEGLMNEIDVEARESQIVHCLAMTFPIFAPKGMIHSMEEFDVKDLFKAHITEAHKDKLSIIVTMFAERKWI